MTAVLSKQCELSQSAIKTKRVMGQPMFDRLVHYFHDKCTPSEMQNMLYEAQDYDTIVALIAALIYQQYTQLSKLRKYSSDPEALKKKLESWCHMYADIATFGFHDYIPFIHKVESMFFAQ